MSNGYRFSRDRLDYLHKTVSGGEDAKMIRHYVDEWIEETKANVLEKLAEPGCDAADLQMYYRAALSFASRIHVAIAQGERKYKTLTEMKREEDENGI